VQQPRGCLPGGLVWSWCAAHGVCDRPDVRCGACRPLWSAPPLLSWAGLTGCVRLCPRPGLAGAVVGGPVSGSSPGLGKVRPVLSTTVDLFVALITRYVLVGSAFQTTNPGRARRLKGGGGSLIV
jgi:hypothetical protein